jgi:hypothetical protein
LDKSLGGGGGRQTNRTPLFCPKIFCWFGVLLNVEEVAFPTFPDALQGSLTRAMIDADFKDTSAISWIRRYAHYLTIQ